MQCNPALWCRTGDGHRKGSYHIPPFWVDRYRGTEGDASPGLLEKAVCTGSPAIIFWFKRAAENPVALLIHTPTFFISSDFFN
jgi:hypothetical protein